MRSQIFFCKRREAKLAKWGENLRSRYWDLREVLGKQRGGFANSSRPFQSRDEKVKLADKLSLSPHCFRRVHCVCIFKPCLLLEMLGSLSRRGHSVCQQIKIKCVSFLPACSGLYLMELGIKQEMQRLPLPSDPNSYILPANFTGSMKKINAFFYFLKFGN